MSNRAFRKSGTTDFGNPDFGTTDFGTIDFGNTGNVRTMGDQPSKLQSFLAELGRRHVVKVAIGYAAVTFVVLQLGEIILPAFSAEWALQYLVVFAVLGFPLVMVMAWVFDITPEGIRKTDALDAIEDYAPGMSSTGVLPRLALLTVTMLAVGGLGWWWVESAVEPPASVATVDGGPTVVPVAYDPDDPIRSLAVLPLDNFSDTSEQDYFAAGMHEALIARLSQLPAIRVVSRTSVARYTTTAKTIPEIAQELGVAATGPSPAISSDRFSKDKMTEKMWSWVVQTPESFPDIAGKVRYLADGGTSVLPVKLQPGRKYAIWINSLTSKHSGFRDQDNNPAVPFLLAFETRR